MAREIRIRMTGSVMIAIVFERSVRIGFWICCMMAFVVVSIVMGLVVMEY